MNIVFKLRRGIDVTLGTDSSKEMFESGGLNQFIELKEQGSTKKLTLTDNQSGEKVETSFSELTSFEINFN
jgi:hypothetical protein